MNHETLWSKTKQQLKQSLPDHAYNTWFDPISSIALNDEELVLEVPNQFFFEWINSHYKATIESTIKTEFALNLAVKYTVSPGKTLPQTSWDETVEQVPPPVRREQPVLNRKYTFSSFIEGANNQFAKAAALTVAESPGQHAFNPLVIYGGVGLGKTHLLHAIGNHILATKPKIRVINSSSEKFTQDFISSIQKNRTVEFAKQYRKADILLIDDIQFFQGKEQTQEQFFHTFNELYQGGKQIVLTADKYPGEMNGLKDRLLSRFQSGLSVDIQPPDFETRVAILMEKSEENGLDLPYEIIEFIAAHIKKSVRDLESTIIRLLAHSSLTNREIDLQLVKEVVKERIGNYIVSDLTIEDIVQRVAEVTHISEKDIVGPSRKKQIVEARQLAVYLCREILNASLVSIGIYFGGRDHTTILHACRTIEKRSRTDQRLENLVASIRQELTLAII
ncbi:MAG: chromosomal replication initiator protein DnaA [FCB group bacterium]|nr:chromosomal replication initiator protein DnaA [FCB group bacterium]